ncbi:MAG: Class A beta-lactamase [uncultured Sphingomonadaceae bacterium]|uniref:beta-lactamase n=1 Tax=uncultured Sphingomonadaceae bacterium TaxID=169976 RepID=A0A6J4ST48_9SPHN|nr:MAG: Class A beta-lactamase [uncultured Sphingomonadaceae bacterium]
MITATPPSNRPLRASFRFASVAALALLAACVGRSSKPGIEEAARDRVTQPPPPSPVAAPEPPPEPAPPPQPVSADPVLASRIASLGRAFPGDVGIAVRDVHEGWAASWNGDKLFPQQSVSKLWVAIALMDAVDQGRLRLTDTVTVTPADFTVFHQPIRGSMRGGVLNTTIGDLLYRAMTQSDNTCNDILLRKIGGPEAVRAVLARGQVKDVRFGPGERLLQAGTAGLTWRPEYAVGNAFYAARGALPASVRQSAFRRYLADPVDGASPDGIADGLAKLKRGELISPQSAQSLIAVMYASKTGPGRMKSGSAPGWLIAHKTGTGQVLNGVQAGYNDVGLVTAPDGSTYAVAIMIGRTSIGLPTRQRLMGDVVRAVVDYETRSSDGGVGAL